MRDFYVIRSHWNNRFRLHNAPSTFSATNRSTFLLGHFFFFFDAKLKRRKVPLVEPVPLRRVTSYNIIIFDDLHVKQRAF